MSPRALLLMLAAVAGCDRAWGLSFDHPDAALDAMPDTLPDAPASAYAQAVLADGPIGYWRFSAGPSPVAADALGGSPGIYVGDAAPSAAGALLEADAALALDGVMDYVDMGARFPFPGKTAFTVEAWVRPTRNGSFTGLISEADEASGGAIRRGYFMYSDAGYFGFNRSDGVSNQEARTSALQPGRWSYVAATYDGAALLLYVDGVLRTTVTTPNVTVPATTMPFVVGARNGGEYLFFEGAIDEVAVYARALAQPQLDAHRLAALAP